MAARDDLISALAALVPKATAQRVVATLESTVKDAAEDGARRKLLPIILGVGAVSVLALILALGSRRRKGMAGLFGNRRRKAKR